MNATVYDEHARFYIDFVDRGLGSRDGAEATSTPAATVRVAAWAPITGACPP